MASWKHGPKAHEEDQVLYLYENSFFENVHVRVLLHLLFFLLLIPEREEGRKEERERNMDSCTCPNWGLNPQPRHIP